MGQHMQVETELYLQLSTKTMEIAESYYKRLNSCFMDFG